MRNFGWALDLREPVLRLLQFRLLYLVDRRCGNPFELSVRSATHRSPQSWGLGGKLCPDPPAIALSKSPRNESFDPRRPPSLEPIPPAGKGKRQTRRSPDPRRPTHWLTLLTTTDPIGGGGSATPSAMADALSAMDGLIDHGRPHRQRHTPSRPHPKTVLMSSRGAGTLIARRPPLSGSFSGIAELRTPSGPPTSARYPALPGNRISLPVSGPGSRDWPGRTYCIAAGPARRSSGDPARQQDLHGESRKAVRAACACRDSALRTAINEVL